MKQKKQSEKHESSAGTEVNSDVESDPLFKRLEQLIAIAEKAELASVRIRDGEVEIEISRVSEQSVSLTPQQTTDGTTSSIPATKDDTGNDIICSPMPARFYRSPGPDEPAFVEIGDTVTAGASLGTLEVMKTYNDVEAPSNCEILEILVEDGEAVEYDQPLFRVRQT